MLSKSTMYIFLYSVSIVIIARASSNEEYIPTNSKGPVKDFSSWGNVHLNSWSQHGKQQDTKLIQETIKNYDEVIKKKNNLITNRENKSHSTILTTLISTTPSTPSGTTPPSLHPLSFPIPSHGHTFPPAPIPSRKYSRSPSNRLVRRTPTPQPYFDPSSPTNITGQLGMQAVIPCIIRNAFLNTISWIRSRDSQILTVDSYTFTADERFQARHDEVAETWTLEIKYVQERDAGRYECQISSEPKMSHFVHFHVVTPSVHISGGPDIYVENGSPVAIKCIISNSLIPPDYILWYQGNERVLTGGRVSRRRSRVEKVSENTTMGILIITEASLQDQGSYTCVPTNLPTAAATLYVLNGERSAAMQHGGGGGGPLTLCPPSLPLLLFCLIAGSLLAREKTLFAPCFDFIRNLLQR